MTLLPNVPEYHALFWGAQTAGVANPVNPMLDAEHIIGLMRSARTRVLVTPASNQAESSPADQQAEVGSGEGSSPDHKLRQAH